MDNQMQDQNVVRTFQIMTLILSDSQCQKFLRIIKKDDFLGGIILLGRGTVKSDILHLFGIKSQKKEIVSILLESGKSKELLDFFTSELQLSEPGHGIAFTTPVVTASQIISKNQGALDTLFDMEDVHMFKKLTVVVNRGMAEDVMDIARKSGVTGGTILHGRGAGSDYAANFLGMDIEPEKELVMILMPSDLVEKVVGDLYKELDMGSPGNGIMFVEPVLDVRGINTGKGSR